MSQQYSSIPEAVPLDDTMGERKRSLSLSSIGSGSDISYNDPLDVEPFNEKRSGSDSRFQDEPALEDGDEGSRFLGSRRLRPRKRSKKTLAVLVGILLFAAVIGALSAFTYPGPSYSVIQGNKHMTMDHIFNGTFSPVTKRIDWVKEAPDGTYSHVDEKGNIVLNTPQSPENGTILVDSERVRGPEGQRLNWQAWTLSADMEYVLFKTDHVKQWRHSSFGNYWIHRRSDLTTFPLREPKNIPSISHVTWAPIGHSIAFVDHNDLYVIDGDQLRGDHPEVIRVTDDGSPVIFNGVPDWVYEEEVFSSDSALWWSPDGNTVAYLRFDEEKVPDYKLQYYNPGNDAFEIHQFPTEVDMKYPKPGNPNPLVDLHTFSLATFLSTRSLGLAKNALTWPGEMSQETRVLMEVGWVADDALIVKEVDRAARIGSVVLFTNSESVGKVVRKLGKDGEEGDDGWIDHGQDIIPVRGDVAGYLDLIPNEGYMHVAFFTPLDATEPIWLTAGEWEVASVDGYNVETKTVYYTAAYPSIDRHVYAETLPSSDNLADFKPNPIAITDSANPGYFEASFSPGARYYVLSYRGPKVPWQRMVEATDTEGSGIDFLLEGNQKLNDTLAEFMAPLVTRSTFEHDGIEMNMLEILPPGIDTSGRKKYPVLFRVYGGPGSQLVSNRYERDWQSYLACEKKYITIIIDGRGTGYRGREFRNPIKDNLGRVEVLDQVAAAREVAKRRYVDRARIGIWGWSYGGFMTCKTVEADSGVFSLGMAVAPVTNWLFYDSIYTERYMNTPSLNVDGYNTASVLNVTAFNNVNFLLAHGSGDDNVHYMNSASLLDKFTQEKVRGFRFRMFTDSHHSMDIRGAYRELYEMMTEFLDQKWGRGGTVRGT